MYPVPSIDVHCTMCTMECTCLVIVHIHHTVYRVLYMSSYSEHTLYYLYHVLYMSSYSACTLYYVYHLLYMSSYSATLYYVYHVLLMSSAHTLYCIPCTVRV